MKGSRGRSATKSAAAGQRNGSWPALPRQRQDGVGGKAAVAVGGDQVAQPAVEEGAGEFVRVEEEGHPRHLGGDAPQLLHEHGGEHAQRVEDQLHVLLAPEPRTERGPQPVGALGELGRIDGSGERPDPGYEPDSGEARLRGDDRPRRGTRARSGAGRLGLVPALAVGGQDPVEGLERVPLAREVRPDGAQCLGHAVDALVGVRGHRPALPGCLLQLPYQEGLADPGVAVHGVDEAVLLVVHGDVEVPLEGGEFAPPPHESGPLAPPDELLHRSLHARTPPPRPRPGPRPLRPYRAAPGGLGERPQSPSTGSSSGRWPSEAWAAATRSAGTAPYSVVRGRDGRPAASAMATRSLIERYEP